MFKALRRWLDLAGRMTDLEERLRASHRRQDVLFDELQHLEAKHEKIRGRITGGLRGPRPDEAPPDLNALIRAGRRPHGV